MVVGVGGWRQEEREPENKPLLPRGSLAGRLLWEECGW